MSRRINGLLMGMLASALLFSGSACRENEPPDAYPRDLGNEDTVLLPTASVFKPPGIAEGRADWVDFRKPQDSEDSDAGAEANVNAAEVEAEIQTMFADYNGLLSDSEATIDDFLDFYVDAQRDLVKSLLESTPALAQTLQQLREELQAKKADESDRIDSAIKILEATTQRELVAKSITVQNESKVTVTLAAGPFAPTCECIVVDDEWFIQLPDIKALQAAKPAMDQVLNTCRGWLDDLKAGRASPEDILQKVDTAARAAQASGSQENDGDESDD